MRTTISLPDPLLENAKDLAAQRGVTLSTLVEDALRRFLATPVLESPPEFHLHTVRGEPVDPTLDLSRTSALVTLDDESGPPFS